MHKFLTLSSCTALLALTSGQVVAQPTEESKLWSGNLDFGYVSTSGNTEDSTLTGKAELKRERDIWRYNFLFESLVAESDGDGTAERYFLSNRLARMHSETDYLFGYMSYDDDRFSGFEYQATFAAGYGRRLFENDTMTWDLEAGPGYRISRVEDESVGDDSSELILRAFTEYLWKISDTANFSQTVNVEAGSDLTTTKSVTGLSVKINSALSLKLAYVIKYSDAVPDDKKHADTESTIAVSYSF